MISSPPLKLDHDYDHENLNDCFHTDCLKGIDKQFHKDISITNGDGTATISVTFRARPLLSVELFADNYPSPAQTMSRTPAKLRPTKENACATSPYL